MKSKRQTKNQTWKKVTSPIRFNDLINSQKCKETQSKNFNSTFNKSLRGILENLQTKN